MFGDILAAAGGIGLFLLGMLILTEGLREAAGAMLRGLLARSTRTPLLGALAGAAATAVLQSSSAVTVLAVGFVGAGLMSFPQALGVIFGANVGTTVTGWLVAVLGFRLDLGTAAMPVVLAGVLLRMFARPRLARIGWALTGFGMLFVGIRAMQDAMAAFEGMVTPDDFPGDGLGGRLLLVLIGAAVTVVVQSSSAGVATALAALATGAISLPQAMALVIGMDIGTTGTAALATLGRSAAARQTGFAHVIYNLMTGVMAFLLLGPVSALAEPWVAEGGIGAAQLALVAFHSGFNALGVVLVLPFARPFARLIQRLVPERGPSLTRRLDPGILSEPVLAVGAAALTADEIARDLAATLAEALAPDGPAPGLAERLAAAQEALGAARAYLDRIAAASDDLALHGRMIGTMHMLDHLLRLSHRIAQSDRIATLPADPRLRRLAGTLRVAASRLAAGEADPAWLDRVRRLMRGQRDGFRARTVHDAAHRRLGIDATLARLDAMRWLHRVAYHLWRVAHHARRNGAGALPHPPDSEAALDIAAD